MRHRRTSSNWLVLLAVIALAGCGGYGEVDATNAGLTAIHTRGLNCAQSSCHAGFTLSGMGKAFLEVTAQNDAAVRLYRRAGFRSKKTVYKAVEAAAGGV